MSDPTNLKEITEEEIKEEARIKELSDKQDRTTEEATELDSLKEEKKTRYQKRIDIYASRTKEAEWKLEEERKRKEELEMQVAELEKTKNVSSILKKEVIDIGGKKFYTDKTLKQMINNKEITDDEAYAHQQERIEEAAADKAYKRIKGEKTREDFENIRKEDAEAVLREYPHFDKNHPNYNPNDPLFKMATEIFREGYAYNPKGFSLSLKRAKQILRMEDKKPDISDELSLHSSSTPEDKKSKKKEITLDEAEKEAAIRMFCRGDVMNPDTNRPYTENEAVMKAIKAKELRTRRE